MRDSTVVPGSERADAVRRLPQAHTALQLAPAHSTAWNTRNGRPSDCLDVGVAAAEPVAVVAFALAQSRRERSFPALWLALRARTKRRTNGQSSFKPAKVFKGHNAPQCSFTSLDFDDRGDWLITAGEDESMQLFDVRTGK